MSSKFTEEQLKEAFKLFDTEGMGYIGAAHLKHIMTSIGDKLSAESAEQLIKDADTDKDGKIDYAAFVKVLLS